MGFRVPFPPGLDEEEFREQVERLLNDINNQRAAIALVSFFGALVIAFMLAWIIIN